MKTTFLLVATLLATIAISASHADQASSEPISDHVRFMVTLSEYQLDNGLPTSASEADILDLIRKANVRPTETIRLSVINDIEGMAQFGRVVAVTAGKTVNREVTTRQMRDVQVGALLKVVISLKGESVMAGITFETSRFQGEGTDDSPSDIASVTLRTNLLIEYGKPCLVGSTSSGKTSYVFVTVTKLP